MAIWPLAKSNISVALASHRRKITEDIEVIHNPERIRSTGAPLKGSNTHPKSCFLCKANRPQEQLSLSWQGYEILVNPYPIFPYHLTIAAVEHTPQSIHNRWQDLIGLSRNLKGLTVFFNGAGAGASVPGHMHFQAAEFDPQFNFAASKVGPSKALIYRGDFMPECEMAEARLRQVGVTAINVLALTDTDDVTTVAIIPRIKHRPECYGTGQGEYLISPASAEMAGHIVTPRKVDFDSLTASKAYDIIAEVIDFNALDLCK